MFTFLYVPVYTMRACTTYIASIKSMLSERCACVLRNMTVCVCVYLPAGDRNVIHICDWIKQ